MKIITVMNENNSFENNLTSTSIKNNKPCHNRRISFHPSILRNNTRSSNTNVCSISKKNHN